MSLGLAAQAELAQNLGLPTWGLAGATDAKVVDAQAGAESAFSILAQGLAGLNLIHDVGYMDNAMVCSVEQLLLGNEVIVATKRFLRGLEINSQTVARDVIARVGPGGNFIEDEHTFAHFRNELWRPRLFTRLHYSAWMREGAKDTAQRIREEIRRLVETHQPQALPDKTLTALDAIKTKGEKELA
jgi:trimethylamine--corrinoid protein Co-methyltransferase